MVCKSNKQFAIVLAVLESLNQYETKNIRTLGCTIIILNRMMILLYSSHLHCCRYDSLSTVAHIETEREKCVYIILDTNLKTKANENKQSENTNINFMAMAPIDIVENDQTVNFFSFYIHISSLVAKLNFILVWLLYFCSCHSIELKRKKIRLSICVSKCSETILVHYWALLFLSFHVWNDSDKLKSILW